MITVTPFEGKFNGEIRTIFSINNKKPLEASSHVTTSEFCPSCEKRNLFRLYSPKRNIKTTKSQLEIYDCKCPNCNFIFDIVIEDITDEE